MTEAERAAEAHIEKHYDEPSLKWRTHVKCAFLAGWAARGRADAALAIEATEDTRIDYVGEGIARDIRALDQPEGGGK